MIIKQLRIIFKINSVILATLKSEYLITTHFVKMIKSRRIKSTNKYKVVDVLASWDRCIAQFSYRSSAPLRSRNWQFHVPCLLRPLFLIFLPFSRVSRPSVGSSGSGPEVQGKLERRAPPLPSLSFSFVFIPSHFLTPLLILSFSRRPKTYGYP